MMNLYYSEDGTWLGMAWSAMRCKKMEDHAPHVHDLEYTIFGPYMCGGTPEVDLYLTKDRKPVNRREENKG